MADYIAHHGVKGMRWGVRKERKKPGSSNPRAKTESNAKKARRNKPNDRQLSDEVFDFASTMIGARMAKQFLGMPYALSAVSNIKTKKQTKGRKAAEAVLLARSAYSVGKVAYKIGQRNLERHNSIVNEIARENGYVAYDWRGRRVQIV